MAEAAWIRQKEPCSGCGALLPLALVLYRLLVFLEPLLLPQIGRSANYFVGYCSRHPVVRLLVYCRIPHPSLSPGSAYTYSYAYNGWIYCLAWVIGWDLIFEYAVGAAATVGISWVNFENFWLIRPGPIPGWIVPFSFWTFCWRSWEGSSMACTLPSLA